MAKPPRTLTDITAATPEVDLAKIDATTEADIRRHKREDGNDPDEPIVEEDIIPRRPSPNSA